MKKLTQMITCLILSTLTTTSFALDLSKALDLAQQYD